MRLSRPYVADWWAGAEILENQLFDGRADRPTDRD